MKPGASRRPLAARSALAVGLAALALTAACGPARPVSGRTSSPVTVASTRPPTTAPPTTAPSTSTPATSTPPTAAPPTTAPPASTGLQVGPGTQADYAVEPQPAPGSCHYRWEGSDPLPDPACTPGAVNPQVTQSDISSTICSSGWTATVRPPENVTSPEKQGSAAAYGYTGSFATAEYDHLVPLELGGDPNDPANLWVEPNDRPGATSTANGKDPLENRLRELVCSGALALATAQQAIAADWVAAAARYG
jgi:hypothetical protein